MRWLASIVALLAGCTPTPAIGFACGDAGLCPAGQSCVGGRCEVTVDAGRGGGVDAAGGDAAILRIDCEGCDDGLRCDLATAWQCEHPCNQVADSCPPGTHCDVEFGCVDRDCGFYCPRSDACVDGVCYRGCEERADCGDDAHCDRGACVSHLTAAFAPRTVDIPLVTAERCPLGSNPDFADASLAGWCYLFDRGWGLEPDPRIRFGDGAQLWVELMGRPTSATDGSRRPTTFTVLQTSNGSVDWDATVEWEFVAHGEREGRFGVQLSLVFGADTRFTGDSYAFVLASRLAASRPTVWESWPIPDDDELESGELRTLRVPLRVLEGRAEGGVSGPIEDLHDTLTVALTVFTSRGAVTLEHRSLRLVSP